jgi:phage-related protein
MRPRLSVGEKPLDWVASSKRDFLAFPAPVQREIGNALGLAQFGGKHPNAKPWKGEDPGVFEVVDDFDGDTYRAVYTVRFRQIVYVLHAFQKKSPRGKRTRLGLNQPKISALRNYKLEGFSVERLMTLLNALDQDIEIVIREKPRSRAAARISVVAA